MEETIEANPLFEKFLNSIGGFSLLSEEQKQRIRNDYRQEFSDLEGSREDREKRLQYMNNVILTTEQLSSIDHEISQLIQQDSTILLNETINDIRKLIVDMLRKDLSSNWQFDEELTATIIDHCNEDDNEGELGNELSNGFLPVVLDTMVRDEYPLPIHNQQFNGYTKESSRITDRIVKQINNILSNDLSEDLVHKAFLCRLFCEVNIPDTVKEQIYEGFHYFANSLPESFQKLVSEVLKNSCSRFFLYKFVLCPYCKQYYDNDYFFCQGCISSHTVLHALYMPCSYEGCACGKRDLLRYEGSTDPNDIDRLRQLQCTHMSRSAKYHRFYFLSPLGGILDSLHCGLHSSYSGINENELCDMLENAKNMGTFHMLTAMNMKKVCDFFGMEKASSLYEDLMLLPYNADDYASSFWNTCKMSSSSMIGNHFMCSVYNYVKNCGSHDIDTIMDKSLDLCVKDCIASMDSLDSNDDQLILGIKRYYFGNCLSTVLSTLNVDCNSVSIGIQSWADIFNMKIEHHRMEGRGRNGTPISDPYGMKRIADSLLLNSLEVATTYPEYLQKVFFFKKDCIKSLNAYGVSEHLKNISNRYSTPPSGLPGTWSDTVSYIMIHVYADAQIDSILAKLRNTVVTASVLQELSTVLSKVLQLYNSSSFSQTFHINVDTSMLDADIDSLIILLKAKGLTNQIRKLSLIKSIISQTPIRFYGKDDPKPLIVPYKSHPPPIYSEEYMNNPNVKQYLANQTKKVSNRGALGIIHEVYAYKLSYDGVSQFRYSHISNSSTVITLSSVNLHHKFHHSGLDIAIASIVPSLPQMVLRSALDLTAILKDSNSYQNKHGLYNMILNAATTNVQKSHKRLNSSCENPDNEVLKDLNTDVYTHHLTYASYTPSDALGREILNLCLKRMHIEGTTGIPVIKDSIVYFINYVVLCALGDIPAADTIMNSNGKKGSYSPCRDCLARPSKWNPYSNTFTTHLNWIPSFENDDDWGSKTFFWTSLCCLELDNILRLLPVFYSLRGKSPEAVVDVLCSYVGNDATTKAYIKNAVAKIMIMVNNVDFPLWIPPSRECFSEYDGDAIKLQPTNNPDAFGFVDLENNTINGATHFHAKDIMHFGANLFDFFMQIIHQREVTGENFLKELNKQMKADGIISKDLSAAVIPDSLLAYANEQFELNERNMSPEKKRLVSCCLKNETNNLTSYDKLIILSTIIPWLFYSALDCPIVKVIINLCLLTSSIYNYRGDLHHLLDLSVGITTNLYFLENLLIPRSLTINLHYLLHFPQSFLYNGPLKQTDCFRPENYYKGLNRQGGTPDPVLTTFYNRTEYATMAAFSSSIVSNNTISVLAFVGNAYNFVGRNDLTCLQWKSLIYLNFLSHNQYDKCDFLPLLTICDILLMSDVSTFLSTHKLPNTPTIHDVDNHNKFGITDEEIRLFLADQSIAINLDHIEEFMDKRIIRSLKWSDHTFDSIHKLYSQLDVVDFFSFKEAFAVVVDTCGFLHFIASLGYYDTVVENTGFAVCFGYEIPTIPYSDMGKSLVFDIMLENGRVDKRLLIVDLSRLIKEFTILYNKHSNCLTVSMDKAFLSQFH